VFPFGSSKLSVRSTAIVVAIYFVSETTINRDVPMDTANSPFSSGINYTLPWKGPTHEGPINKTEANEVVMTLITVLEPPRVSAGPYCYSSFKLTDIATDSLLL
jgi:hypothetical protein